MGTPKSGEGPRQTRNGQGRALKRTLYKRLTRLISFPSNSYVMAHDVDTSSYDFEDGKKTVAFEILLHGCISRSLNVEISYNVHGLHSFVRLCKFKKISGTSLQTRRRWATNWEMKAAR